MNKLLKEKIEEALSSVLPITLIVLLLSVTIAPMPIGTLMMFFVGAVLLIFGMGFFSLGADIAMMPMGSGIGAELTKSRKIWMIVVITFVMGALITIAEPDLQVLATQAPGIPSKTLILSIAIGVGFFLVIGTLRTLLKVQLSHILIVSYLIIFILSMFAPNDFIAIAFDSGGVTTGPMTVPFILALGIGMASVRGDKNAQDDSFGLIALASAGPIIAVMVLGIVFKTSSGEFIPITIPEVITSQDVIKQFVVGLPLYVKEVSLALIPIGLFFGIFQFITKRFKPRQLKKIAIGAFYTFVGLILFLTGVNIGFMPAGYFIGADIAALSYRYILIPIGMVVGYFIVSAEPAVHVLTRQVEEISSGAIPAKAMQYSLAIGVAISVGLATFRLLSGISIYWLLIPGYAMAIGLSFFVPKIFTAIAFDSGGVASGPMTATFLLPLAMGATTSVGGNILTDAFGIVAMVAMTPLITIQLLGLLYQNKMNHATSSDANKTMETDDEIITYVEVVPNE